MAVRSHQRMRAGVRAGRLGERDVGALRGAGWLCRRLGLERAERVFHVAWDGVFGDQPGVSVRVLPV